MKKTISIIRIAVLMALGLMAFVSILSEPVDNSTTWMLDFILWKVTGFLICYFIYRLYNHWVKIDPWLQSWDKECDDANDTSNPMTW